MLPVRSERQRFDLDNGGEVERAVEMRKQIPGARRLPFQLRAELAGVHAHQKQIMYSCKVFRRGLRNLIGRREMNETIASIVS